MKPIPSFAGYYVDSAGEVYSTQSIYNIRYGKAWAWLTGSKEGK